MKKTRTVLGVLGGIGVLAWPVLSFTVWLFHNWKPGGAQGGLTAFQGWFCALSLVAVSVYYIAVAASEWSRWLFVAGGILHTTILISVVMLISSTDSGVLIAPVILVGPTIWITYAMRISESPQTR